MDEVTSPRQRRKTLERWQDAGGVMLLGYEMYRNLLAEHRKDGKKEKRTLKQVPSRPPPDPLQTPFVAHGACSWEFWIFTTL
eukprot:509530-Prorocentrum_minimum.AAC.1